MAKTLDELVADLLQLRRDNPGSGSWPVTVPSEDGFDTNLLTVEVIAAAVDGKAVRLGGE